MDRGFNLSGIKVGSSSNEGFAKDFEFSGNDKGFSGQQQSRRDGQNQDSQRRPISGENIKKKWEHN